MTRRKNTDSRQEPEFGYTRRGEPHFDQPQATVSERRMRPKSRRRSLVPVFLVGAVIILFVGFLWISYVRGPKAGAGQLPVIIADISPVKIKPDKPGGAEIPFQDTTVYDNLNQGKQKHPQPEVEHLLQPPEQPLPMPVPAAGVTPSPPAVVAAVIIPQEPSKEAAIPTSPAGNEAVLAPQPEPATSVEKLPPPPAESALPTPVITAVVPTVKPSPVVTEKPKIPAPSGIKNCVVQLGSFKDQDAAKTEWQRLRTRYSDQLASLSPIYQRVDLSEKGVWYRLRAGSLTADKAKSVCVALTNAKAPCIVSTR